MAARIRCNAVGVLIALLSFGCNETPADLRDWRTSDHDHTATPNADQVRVSDAGASGPGHGLDDVTIVAWQQNCTSCHGPLGRGDGPQGQLLHASDLSRPDWQASITDEAIASIIRQGRGRMPAFNLPEATLARLVALIRMLDRNRMQQVVDAAAAANSAGASGPAPSGAPANRAAAKAPASSAPTSSGRAPQRVGR